jgi:hypothetical protein
MLQSLQNLDISGGGENGWESSPTLAEFSVHQKFNNQHRFRRRRWYRKRLGCAADTLIDGVTAFCQPTRRGHVKQEDEFFKMNVQVDGGKWATTPLIPNRGAAHGVLRVAKARWPYRQLRPDAKHGPVERTVYEICYSIAPIDNEWGDLTRLMVITSRFLLRNDSKAVSYDVKQAGSDDACAVNIGPGATVPFHWGDFRLPMLISVRPAAGSKTDFRWSGGFDPLTIGALPVRIRRACTPWKGTRQDDDVVSVKVESEIRSKTGGTGISLVLREEDPDGYGALFRVENQSTFPIWFCQDGLLANADLAGQQFLLEGDVVHPRESAVFALDVPFRQGKYAGRKAASMTELLRARVALAPLNSRNGIETTKVVSMTAIGDRVRLNPTRIMLFSSELRSSIRRIRVVGTVINDGPTLVLRFR